MHFVRSFFKGYTFVNLHGFGPTPEGQFENRINLNYTIMSKLICNIKYIYRVSTDHRSILVVADEVTNYLVTSILYRETLSEVGEALMTSVFCKHTPFSFNIS